MAKWLVVVATDAVEGREDEFNEWYNRHVQAQSKLTGMVRITRYVAEPIREMGERKGKYLALFEMEGEEEDIPKMLEEHDNLVETLETTDTLIHRESGVGGWYRQIYSVSK